jgi:hypothetical protein
MRSQTHMAGRPRFARATAPAGEEPSMSTPNSDRPADTEVDQRPTVASVAAVASTTDDLEAAEPTHPDRPVGVNVDTASVGTEPGATEALPEKDQGSEDHGTEDRGADEDFAPDEDMAEEDMAEDSDEALGASQTDAADSRES